MSERRRARKIPLPYFQPGFLATTGSQKSHQSRTKFLTVTINIEMKPQTIGRALGIGLRVAGRMAGQRVAAGAQAAASQPGPQSADAAAQSRAAGHAAGKASRGVVKGVGGFLRPFGRVGGILWLEVTGVFFFLFALVFGTATFRNRPIPFHGPYGKPFLASAVLMLLFAYLGISSFLRARRR